MNILSKLKLLTPIWVGMIILFLGTIFILPCGTENLRMVQACSMDEFKCGQVVMEMITNHDFIFPQGFYFYQSVYFYLSYLVFKIYTVFTNNSEVWVNVGLSMRFVSLLMSIAAMYVVCLIIKLTENKNKFLILYSIFIIVTIGEYLYMSITVHPDTTQLFFVLTSFLLLFHYAKKDKIIYFIFSSICTGLAAGTKYIGFFMIPVILIFIHIYVNKGFRIKWFNNFLQVLKLWILYLLIFFVTFIITNIHWIVKFQESYYLFEQVYSLNKFGLFKKFTIDWLVILAKVGYGTFGMGILWVIYRGYQAIKYPYSLERLINGITVLWFLLLYIYLLVGMHGDFGARHLFPVIPFLVIGGNKIIWENLLKLRLFGISERKISIIIILILCMTNINGLKQFNYVYALKFNYRQAPNVLVGQYLQDNYDHDLVVYSQYCVYIPPVFRRVFYYFSTINEEDIFWLNPDIIVTSDVYDNISRITCNSNVCKRFFKKNPRYRYIISFDSYHVFVRNSS